MIKTLYMHIAEQIVHYIKDNNLKPGEKLPSFREFADYFNVSAHTVNNAIERLNMKGIVEIYPQSRVVVAENARQSLFPNRFDWNKYLSDLPDKNIELYRNITKDFPGYNLTSPFLAPEFNWFPLFERSVQKAISNVQPEALNTVTGMGYQPLRKELSEYFKFSGLDIPSDGIIVTIGLNYSLLIILYAFFPHSAVCYYASPSAEDLYLPFDLMGIRKVPIPLDEEGPSLEYFSSKIDKNRKSFFIMMPVIQSVSGKTMSMQRRRDLYSICFQNNIPIIEVDEHRDLHNNPLPPVKALDNHGLVFYIGTFSKTLSCSVSLGWIAASPELIERLAHYNLSMGQYNTTFMQRVLYEALSSGDYRSYTCSLRKLLEQRKLEMNSILNEYMSDIATWDKNSDIYFWIRFKDYIDVNIMASYKDNIVFVENKLYAFSQKNSVWMSSVKFNIHELREAVKHLSFLARKSVN